MKSRLSSFGRLLKKKRVYIPLIIVLALIGWKVFGSNASDSEILLTVEAATFVQEVGVTGKVIAAKDVDMGFESSGRVSKINVDVGSKVSAGQVLASLSNGDAAATVLQRQARVDAQAAKLAEVQKGSRQEDINIAQAEAEGAVTAYNQSIQSLVDEIKDSYAKSDDVLRSKIDQLYSNPRTVTPEIISFDNYNLRIHLNEQRVKAGEMIAAWNKSLSALSVSGYSETYIAEARANLNFMRDYLNGLTSAVAGMQPAGAMTQSTIDKYRSDISSARSTIGAAISSLASAEQSYKTALTTKQTKEQQLNLKKAGSTSEQIAAQLAELKSAQADVRSAQAALSKTVIVAPFSGTITKVDIKEGEIVSTTVNAISMISSAGYEIESFVSESDVSKVRVGQPARVTLDAYGRDVIFEATVSQVDPAETELDGVSTYKTKLQFKASDDRVRSGMTANVMIQTAEKPASVIIPQEALFLENGEKVVTVDQAGTRINKKVITGGINEKGQIEVLEGLSIGETIVIKKK